jgi:hypothetical protein
MMWERCTELVEKAGIPVVMRTKVTSIRHRGAEPTEVVTTDRLGATETHACTDVVSSMPFPLLLRAMDPPPPAEVLAAADGLTFRDFLTVALVVPERYSFPTTGSTSTPRGEGRPHPELRLVVALPHQGGAHVPRPRVLRLRG